MVARLRVGLTGGIASGKSTVSQRFVELGVPVIDADESARVVVLPDTPGLRAVVTAFGPEILRCDGTLDRQTLRNMIFADSRRRVDLEQILHPLIRTHMDERAAAALGPYVVLAIPLLIESGRLDRVDRILVVDVDEATQLKRLLARDPGSPEQARAILDAQTDRNMRLKYAHDVLRNFGSVSELRRAVDDLHRRYMTLTETWEPSKH